MISFYGPLLLALVSGVVAQSAAGPAAGNGAGAVTPPQVTPSINPNLPKSALVTGPSGYKIPDLASITANAETGRTVGMYSTGLPGATPSVSGAPVIPSTPVSTNYPALDKIPLLDSPQVKQWISEINWSKVPNFGPTDGSCAGSPAAAQDKSRCWWTCGGCTRPTDISECPDKWTWGLSFDDGPSPYTPLLLDYLNEKNIKSTFFVVGSRVVSYPHMLVTEYLAGHQISIHTWSHASLTKLSNEEIVAELGWTKQAIHDVIGITPNTFRPPYGDIDDRVRAIAAQMGLTPVMWTQYQGHTFDTTDWNIPGGVATGETALSKFQVILDEYGPKLDTGIIVLQHDLYQQTVDLAVGYFLPMAIQSGKYAMKSIIECLGLPESEGYIETSANATETQIPGTVTVFQPKVGTVTGAAPVRTNGSNGSNGSKSSAGTPGVQQDNAKSGAGTTYAPIGTALCAVLAAIALA